MVSSGATFRNLELAIRAAEDLVRALRSADRENWPVHIELFIETLSRSGPSEPEVLTLVLHSVGRRLHALITGTVGPRQLPDVNPSMHTGELLEQYRREWLVWAGGPMERTVESAERPRLGAEDRYMEPPRAGESGNWSTDTCPAADSDSTDPLRLHVPLRRLM